MSESKQWSSKEDLEGKPPSLCKFPFEASLPTQHSIPVSVTVYHCVVTRYYFIIGAIAKKSNTHTSLADDGLEQTSEVSSAPDAGQNLSKQLPNRCRGADLHRCSTLCQWADVVCCGGLDKEKREAA
ncbi:hypothetical protein H920_13207 [Fukomys damarensis]|uniref:Uncharacterized protein n=1 Tax=Fukomys damarensis TaxID=885580 RepID=A0A091DRK4_FUKDA|nr:hypothetical protein H920_13207 [Fukomys damarensis]